MKFLLWGSRTLTEDEREIAESIESSKMLTLTDGCRSIPVKYCSVLNTWTIEDLQLGWGKALLSYVLTQDKDCASCQSLAWTVCLA